MTIHSNTHPLNIEQILYLFEQNCHKRRIDSLSESQLTTGLLKEKTEAKAAIHLLMVQDYDQGRIDSVALLIETFEATGKRVSLDRIRQFQAGQLLAQHDKQLKPNHESETI